MNLKTLTILFVTSIIYFSVFPKMAHAQMFSVTNCHWLNSSATPNSTQSFDVTWSALGSGNIDAEVITQPPLGATSAGWDLNTSVVVNTNMTGTWAITKNSWNGAIEFKYTDYISDGDWAIFRSSATHDGSSSTMSSNVTNVIPGASSCFNVIPVQTSLSINITEFDLHALGTTAYLNWTTNSEENFSHFVLQASGDGVDFEDIASIDSEAAAESDLNKNYSFIDELATSRGTRVYYRLQQVDADQSYKFSDIKMLDFSLLQSENQAYPNPVNRGQSLNIISENFQSIQLMNVNGQVLFSEQYEDAVSSVSIPTDDLSPGVYFISLDARCNMIITVQ